VDDRQNEHGGRSHVSDADVDGEGPLWDGGDEDLASGLRGLPDEAGTQLVGGALGHFVGEAEALGEMQLLAVFVGRVERPHVAAAAGHDLVEAAREDLVGAEGGVEEGDDFVVVALLLTSVGQVAGHGIEGIAETLQLVAPGDADAGIQIALLDRLRSLEQDLEAPRRATHEDDAEQHDECAATDENREDDRDCEGALVGDLFAASFDRLPEHFGERGEVRLDVATQGLGLVAEIDDRVDLFGDGTAQRV